MDKQYEIKEINEYYQLLSFFKARILSMQCASKHTFIPIPHERTMTQGLVRIVIGLLRVQKNR